MHRQILLTCAPFFILLVALFILLRLLIAFSGAKWKFISLKQLHRCERGSVQSLSLVLTTPVFIMIVMFIVQVAHFMVGIMVVNYAAFASARSAIVWVPASVDTMTQEHDKPNRLPDSASAGTNNGLVLTGNSQYVTSSRKCAEIFSSAAMICSICSPSSSYTGNTGNLAGQYVTASQNAYNALVPNASSNSRIPVRLSSQLLYSFDNTTVRLNYIDLNSQNGPTYNPFDHPVVEHVNSEVGWQDPIIITVEHKFALLPGPGKYLAAILTDGNGNRSTVSDRVTKTGNTYQTTITASVMLTNEGRISLRERIHSSNQEPDSFN